MKKIFLYNIIVLLSAVLVLNSCTNDFDEINTNENQPTADQAAPDMLLTNAIESMTDRVHEIFLGHEMGSGWVQHMAKVQYTDEDRYIPRVAVINNTWTSFYASSGFDVATIISFSEAKGVTYDNYRGVGLVLQAYITSVLTDLHGDVPFSEAWKGSIIAPKYDAQADIYAALNDQLELANTLLDPDGEDISGDILYDNDIVLWKKFANSLRLRLLLRMSGRVDVTADMTAIVNDPTTYPIFEGNEDNAALIYLGSAPNNNPINENRKTRDDHRVSKTLVDLLYTTAPSPDLRVAVYAELAPDQDDYVGLPNGMLSADAANYLGNGLANTSKIGRYFSNAEAPGMLMSYAELQFILAEAAHKTFVPGGEAQAAIYYEEGIDASFYQYDDVFTDAVNYPVSGIWKNIFEVTWGYGAGTYDTDLVLQDYKDWGGWFPYDPAHAMEMIATQRWIATFDQGLQAWFEWRRTGYPALTPAVAGMNGGTIPVRVEYPSDEYSRNPSSVAAAVTAIGGSDDMKTRVWWDID